MKILTQTAGFVLFAVGMLQFLNGYWVVTVAVYWCLVFILDRTPPLSTC